MATALRSPETLYNVILFIDLTSSNACCPDEQDMHKLMNKDKIILRFTARMVATERAPLSLADAGAGFGLGAVAQG